MRGFENGLRRYLDQIGRHPVLTREEEGELFRRIGRGDEEARARVVHCNLKFVIRLALQFRGRGLPLEDLIQEGNVGLLEAIEKFDYRLGYRFSTYAAFWIRQAIQVGVRQRGSLIRLPVRKARMLGFMNEAIQASWAARGRPPTEGELAERLGITEEAARELAGLGEAVLSLDSPAEEEGTALLETLADTRTPSAEEEARREEMRAKVRAALRELTEREGKVIEQRFGFGSHGAPKSLRKVSRRLGLSQEGVRRIEQRALRKMRRPRIRRAIAGLL